MLCPAARRPKAGAPGGKDNRKEGEEEELPRIIRGVGLSLAISPSGSSGSAQT
jgi:hypothetical protein